MGKKLYASAKLIKKNVTEENSRNTRFCSC